MSLFPAYSQEPTQNPSSEATWLANPSFQTETLPKSPKDAVPRAKSKKKSEKKRKRRKEESVENAQEVDNSSEDFFIDTKKTRDYLTVATISRPAAPRFFTTFYVKRHSVKKSGGKFKRYFRHNLDVELQPSEITAKTVNSLPGSRPDSNFTGFQQEETLSKSTEKFNRKLQQSPNDVRMWLDYVNFQDTVYDFEKTYRKGSVAKGRRVLAERKISIIDKALGQNPKNELLLRERLRICQTVYPSDELQVQLKELVDKDSANIILWQGYIESYQCSMSHCNTPNVIELYTKCLAVLHKLRRSATMERSALEENILRMLYQTGLFLKQAGLFEQLWTLLRLYLELNLNLERIEFGADTSETELVELEEVVFKSGLPLHELWLRVEKLRECCHWLPAQGHCEDPQRLVFADDVTELIHPITMPENIFKLIATILNLLKVPLLPCRHVLMQDLGLDYVPWALDSIELLLPVFFPIHPVDLTNEHFLIDGRLSVGPQYLKNIPGQSEYLDFVLEIFKKCTESTSSEDKQATTLWWLRFQRLLIILNDKQCKLPNGYAKKIKSNVKNMLKHEHNRNNTTYYAEYALIERALGNETGCIDIIKTALRATNAESKCFLYKTLVEIYLGRDLDQSTRDLVMELLIEFVLEAKIPPSAINLLQLKLKFQQKTTEILETNMEKPSAAQMFLPNSHCDFLILNGWFIFLTEGIEAFCSFMDEIVEKWDQYAWHCEVMYEFYVSVLMKKCSGQLDAKVLKRLDGILQKALEKYPNNLLLLSVLAKQQSITQTAAQPWWKLQSFLISTNRAFPIIFIVLITNQKLMQGLENVTETITGAKCEIDTGHRNRMLAIFRRLTDRNLSTRRCGLLWRLYLQFVHSHMDAALCRNVYYSAVEECPWLKALYIDAAIYIPAELAQIQDLLIEKQLRLHVTPEELDVLRS